MAAGILTFVGGAAAHIRLDSPTARSSGSEVGPCGDAGTARSESPTVLEGGQELTVSWTEVIDHPSHYRIALLLDGEEFPVPTSQSDLCDPDVDSWCIADGLPDESGAMQSYSHTFTVPNVDCDNCTLQVIQNTFVRYFQCADITIVAKTEDPDDMGVGGTGGSDAGAPTGGTSAGGGDGSGGLAEPGTGGGGDPADLEDEGGVGESDSSGESAGCGLAAAAPPAAPWAAAPWALLLPLLWAARRRFVRREPLA